MSGASTNVSRLSSNAISKTRWTTSGPRTSASCRPALFARASRLWKVDVRKPRRVLGKNTAEAIQAGLYYGYIGLVDGILERLLEELPSPCAVVATGGQAELIASGSRFIREVDPHLTLTGLRLICERNRVHG